MRGSLVRSLVSFLLTCDDNIFHMSFKSDGRKGIIPFT